MGSFWLAHLRCKPTSSRWSYGTNCAVGHDQFKERFLDSKKKSKKLDILFFFVYG